MRASVLLVIAACGGAPKPEPPVVNAAPPAGPTAMACPPELVGADGRGIPRTLYELGVTSDQNLRAVLVATSAGWMVSWNSIVDLRAPDLATRMEALTGVKPEARVMDKQVALTATWGEHELDASGVGTEMGELSHGCRLDGTSFTVQQARAFLPALYPPVAEAILGEILDGQSLDMIIAGVDTEFAGEIEFHVRGTPEWRTGIEAKLAADATSAPIVSTNVPPTKSFMANGPPGWKVDVTDDGEITIVELDWTID